MTTKYETEIEEITAQRAALAARMNELVKMKDMEKTLKNDVACSVWVEEEQKNDEKEKNGPNITFPIRQQL